MASATPQPQACCDPCTDPVVVNIPGPAGTDGAPGADGADGENAHTFTSANYTQPAAAANVTVTCLDTDWMTVGQIVFIEGGGYYEVVSKNLPDGGTEALLENLDYDANPAAGTVIGTGAHVSPAGEKGETGADAVGALLVANDLSDLNNVATALTNLGIGTAGVLDTGVANGNVAIIDDAAFTATEAVFATAAGLESQAPATARTSLGLAIGTDVQAYDPSLAAIAVVVQAADKVPYFTGATAADGAVADFPAFGRTLVANTTAALARTDLGLTLAVDAVVFFQEQQASNTSGGTFTNGAWRTRTLNTEVTDTAAIASVAASQVTLAAGTYRFSAMAVAFKVDQHQARLYDITNGAVLGLGLVNTADAANQVANVSQVVGRFTIAGATVIELQHRCVTTRVTDGFGLAANFGNNEVYSQVLFEREAG